MLADLRYAIRQLIRRPVFTVVALLTMALGVGANSAIFSIVNAVLLRPLPVDAPEELVDIYTLDGDETFMNPHDYPDYVAIREDRETFVDVAAYAADFVSMTIGTGTEVLFGETVSGNYFQVLGVPAARGRALQDGVDDVPGTNVAVISHGLWTRHYGADPDVVGQTITLRGRPFEIVGVAPDWFKGLWVGFTVDVWLPASAMTYMNPTRSGLEVRSGRNFLVKGRLQPGGTRPGPASKYGAAATSS
jgi:ABC-type antimicrobial peptide transport system permease subunit